MEPRRYLRCLGQPALFAATGEPIRFRTKKHLALLVYLAVEHRRSHRRDRLAEFFWPSVRISEARHSLATALSILRPRLGMDVLESSREHVSLPAGRVALDLDRLLAGDVLGSETEAPLEVAAFLDGFEIADAGEFAHWKDRQQARLLPAVKDALIVLIDRCRRTGDSRQIEQLADRMLLLDELSEEAIRAKMEARAFAGDRLTALKIFEAWKEKLAEELGAVPSDLVDGMAVRLRRRGWERTTRIDIPTVPTDQWRGRPFIGRSREYRVLYEAWEDMRKGVSAHPLVLGDSGIGKTTLVERLTTAAGLEGAAISRVQCYDLEREIPYATVGSLIHGLLDRPGVSGTPPEALAELARTVPEVRRRFSTIPPCGDSQGETARIRLTEAFHDMLQAIAEEHPVILVVDDLHLADDASLAVLHLVMRRAKGQPIMVIMIARPGELPRSPQAGRLRDGSRGLGIRIIELSPLDEDEGRELLMALLSPDLPLPGATVKRLLLKAAAGFPMVLELLVQDWQSNGNHSLSLAVNNMTAELGGAVAPPAVYSEVLERIVRSLDAATHSVLNLAAILGPHLNDVTLYPLADVGIGQTMTGMAELVARRVLRDAGNRLEFVNELVRTAAYLGVPSPLRRHLHGKVADVFIQEDKQNDKGLGLAIAWHCTRAGRMIEAVPHLIRGARDAMRAGASFEAESALASALPQLSGADSIEALLLLVEALQEQGRWADSLDLLLSLTEDSLAGMPDRALIFTVLAGVNLGSATALDTQASFPRLIAILRDSPNQDCRVSAGYAIAMALNDDQDPQWGIELLGHLSSVDEASLDSDALGKLALTRGRLLHLVGDTHASLRCTQEGLEALRRRGAANLLTARLHIGLGTIESRRGRYEQAIPHYEEGFRLATRLGNDTNAALAAAHIALCCGRLGRHEEQLQWALKAPVSDGPEFTGFVEIQIAYSVSLAQLYRKRFDLVLKTIDALESRLVGPIPKWILQGWKLWKADLLLLADQREKAFDEAKEALQAEAFTLHTPIFTGPYSRWLAVTAATQGERLRAREIIDGFVAGIERYDALDQAEVLSAAVILGGEIDTSRTDDTELLPAKLRRLPPSVGAYLTNLLSPFRLPQADGRPRDLP
jgi:DNA-binding SARP family transcriptional activator/tetratricopeptide (TPR) repeat protein